MSALITLRPAAVALVHPSDTAHPAWAWAGTDLLITQRRGLMRVSLHRDASFASAPQFCRVNCVGAWPSHDTAMATWLIGWKLQFWVVPIGMVGGTVMHPIAPHDCLGS